MSKRLTYRQICAECGSFDVDYVGSTNNNSRWYCNSCKKPVEVKTKKVLADV
jgi:transposase-like protein